MLCENFNVVTWGICCTGMHMYLLLRNFPLIPGNIFSLCSSHPIYFHPQKWHELIKCKLFVKANTVGYGLCSSPTSSWPKTDQRGVFTAISLVVLLPLLALNVCLFVCLFVFVNNLKPFRFHDMTFLLAWMTQCNQTDNKSLVALASSQALRNNI